MSAGAPADLLASAGARTSWWASPPAVIGLIGLYLGAHLALRLLASPTLGIDDAEQALFAQAWSLGYRLRQPPLYTWLALPAVEALRPTVLALGLVRYALLGLTYVLVYLTALRWIADRRLAALAVFSYALIYVVAYYAHHDLTHTTALGALVAATFYVFARLVERPGLPAYAWLGVCFGLGMLTKYNYVMLAAGLALTCLVWPRFRPLVLSPRSLVFLAVAASIVAAPAAWVFAQGATLGSVSHAILVEDAGPGAGAALVDGTLALLEATLVFPLPFLPLFLVVFAPALRRALSAPADDQGRAAVTPGFLATLIGVTLALHWLLVPAAGATAFTERWMHPALMILPVALFMLAERGRPGGRSIAVYLMLIVLMVVVAFGARIARAALGADHCGSCREMVAFAPLAAGLRAAGFARGTIVVPPEEYHIGGNLRRLFPDSRIVDPAYPASIWPDPSGDGQCLLVWNASRANAVPPAASLAWIDAPADTAYEDGQVDALMFGSRARRYTLGYRLFPDGAGACR